jgi:ABC-type phosphate/phosphonate transport system substrate-binding protein
MDITRIVDALCAGPIADGPLIAALPMYDWPERRAQVDAQWAGLRDALRARGVDAPERLARSNADLPIFDGSSVDLPPDEFDLATLWRHPNLLFSQTCWGPMELGLESAVRVVGQEDYAGIEGGAGEFYSSAIVMRGDDLQELRSTAPPSALSGISPTGWEIGAPTLAAKHQISRLAKAATPSISPPVGEMSDRTEWGASLRGLLTGQRLAYNSPDSMSGYLALERDLKGLDIISQMIISGGHRSSIRMVASGAADVAAVDCKSWALALEYEPAARELVVVGWTERRKGLPFITGLPSRRF